MKPIWLALIAVTASAQPPPLPHSTNYWLPAETSFTDTTVGAVQGFRVHRLETNWFGTYRAVGTNATGAINGLTFSVPIYVQPGQVITSTNIVYGPETGLPLHFIGVSKQERVLRYFFLSGTNRIYLAAPP